MCIAESNFEHCPTLFHCPINNICRCQCELLVVWEEKGRIGAGGVVGGVIGHNNDEGEKSDKLPESVRSC